MKLHSLAFLTLTFPVFAASPPAADREAILAMAGTHTVHFHFQEHTPVAEDYQLAPKAYDEEATEVIEIVEDTPTRIALQHLLVVKGKDDAPMVIKHWAQIWTWEDTRLIDYCGEDQIHDWAIVELTPEQAAGTWTQLVTQVDDTPRYEGYGKWIHSRGESSWKSNATRRPLPRREYTTRDDYDYLIVTNRHTLTHDGWVHYQDNRKIVDRGDAPAQVLCFETGINTYTRTESPLTEVAKSWWQQHGDFWDGVREFWSEAQDAAPASFSYTTSKDGKSLSKVLDRLQEENASAETVAAELSPFVIAK
ncbi:DUF6607 family protein [Haloferula sargassicola]|uniref:Secreted protein n=1 Tax=Haloferula sargassicola TaxID=490096 RepID=A0ABP9UTB5_9BACT